MILLCQVYEASKINTGFQKNKGYSNKNGWLETENREPRSKK
jgi:hypothetical protein